MIIFFYTSSQSYEIRDLVRYLPTWPTTSSRSRPTRPRTLTSAQPFARRGSWRPITSLRHHAAPTVHPAMQLLQCFCQEQSATGPVPQVLGKSTCCRSASCRKSSRRCSSSSSASSPCPACESHMLMRPIQLNLLT